MQRLQQSGDLFVGFGTRSPRGRTCPQGYQFGIDLFHPERVDRHFLWWIATYRRRSRPKVFALVSAHAPDAKFLVLRSPRAVRELLDSIP